MSMKRALGLYYQAALLNAKTAKKNIARPPRSIKIVFCVMLGCTTSIVTNVAF